MMSLHRRGLRKCRQLNGSCDAQKVYGPDAESFVKYFGEKLKRFEFYGVSRLTTCEVI